MNYCCIHRQFYAEACVYCGPPPYSWTPAGAHVCVSVGTGNGCMICGRPMTGPDGPYWYGITWCSDDSIRFDDSHITIT